MNSEINTFFRQVYVINLTTRVDRRVEMEEQLGRIGLSFNSPGLVLFEAIRPVAPSGFPSVGAYGCFMSHLAVLRAAKAQGADSVLILEDDLNFCEGFTAKFDRIARCLEASGWGMFYGSYHLYEPPEYSDLPCVKVAPQLPVGTSAFLAINGKHLGALIDYLEAMLSRPPGDPLGGPMHIDGAYCWFRQAHPEVATWLAREPLGYQRASKTDVHHLRWYDRTPWLEPIVSRLRRLKNLARH